MLGDGNTTEESAPPAAAIANLGNLWMMHMWNVPGWESRWGFFSSEHPDLGGTIGNLNATPDEVKARGQGHCREEGEEVAEPARAFVDGARAWRGWSRRAHARQNMGDQAVVRSSLLSQSSRTSRASCIHVPARYSGGTSVVTRA